MPRTRNQQKLFDAQQIDVWNFTAFKFLTVQSKFNAVNENLLEGLLNVKNDANSLSQLQDKVDQWQGLRFSFG